MKKKSIFFFKHGFINRIKIFIFLFLLIFWSNTVTFSQEQEKKIKEYISVQNIELIIRALRNGKPIGGLKESDFILLENKKKMKITSLVEIRRKIGVKKIEMTIKKHREVVQKKRLFFIYFWIYEPEIKYQKVLDYFFNNTYREGDLVLIIVKNHVFKISKRDQITRTLSQFKKKMDELTRFAKIENKIIADELEEVCENYKNEVKAGFLSLGELQARLGTRYKSIWREFKYKRLTLNVKQLLLFADQLKKIDIEKWGLVFYQRDIFPRLDPLGDLIYVQNSSTAIMALKKMFSEILMDLRIPDLSVHYLREVQQAFISANITFHLILLSSKTKNNFSSTSLIIDDVSSGWKTSFQSISKATGGEVIESNKLVQSLSKVVKKEDISYRITYSPQELDKKKRKIKVRANDKSIDVFYGRVVNVKKIDVISISNFSFLNNILKFTLKDYQLLFEKNRLFGWVEIKIKAIDKKGKILNFKKLFELSEKQMDISLKLNFPHKGKYKLTIESLDKHSGKKAVLTKGIKTNILKHL